MAILWLLVCLAILILLAIPAHWLWPFTKL